MISLLKFFIPNIIKNTLFVYVIALGIAALLMVSPMNSEDSSTFAGILVAVMFPLYAYFNSSNYLSASLGWILQTPVPKLSIILANGILNIFKLTLTTLLLLMSWLLAMLIVKGKFLLPDFIVFIGTFWFQNGTSQDIPIQNLYFYIFLGTGACAVLFGILPDVIGKAQAQKARAQSQQINLKTLTSKQSAKKLIGFSLMIVFSICAENSEIPNFLIFNLYLTGGILLSIYLTLNSVKLVYDVKKPIAFMVLVFFIGSYLSVKIGNQQISNQKITLDDRFELVNFLGSYHENAYEKLFKELMTGLDSSVDLGRNDLFHAVRLKENKEFVDEALEQLISRCNTQFDHTCRLASYITNIRSGVKFSLMDLDFLRKGCPKDLASCSLLGLHTASAPEDHAVAHSVMLIECRIRKDAFNQRICSNYYGAKLKQGVKI